MAEGGWPMFTHEENLNLPDGPLLKELNQLRDLILGLNPELKEVFGPDAVLDVQRVNPDSVEYQRAGFRWFVILPWPQMSGEALRNLVKYVMDKIISFEDILNAESFGCSKMVVGGAMALMIGLRPKPKPVTTKPVTI